MNELRDDQGIENTGSGILGLFSSFIAPSPTSEVESNSDLRSDSYSDELDGVFETHR